ncbi:hypothetical protein ACHAC9_00925 [Massilia sp. CMS3.1]|uniref:hypothetical protein n=1 Tax=Massilia sp. CMS3.1 TaxID=3373083 RepID=UPI003EE753A5
MSSSQSARPSTSVPDAGLLSIALSFVQKLAERIVVPVATTEDMQDPWRLYRLTPVRTKADGALATDTGRQAS